MNEAQRRRLAKQVPTMGAGGIPIEPEHEIRRPVGWEYRPACLCDHCLCERAGRVLDERRAA